MKHTLKCWLWKGLWLLSVVAAVLAWVGLISRSVILGIEPLAWFWTALVLAVWAIPIKLNCADCGVCSPK